MLLIIYKENRNYLPHVLDLSKQVQDQGLTPNFPAQIQQLVSGLQPKRIRVCFIAVHLVDRKTKVKRNSNKKVQLWSMNHILGSFYRRLHIQYICDLRLKLKTEVKTYTRISATVYFQYDVNNIWLQLVKTGDCQLLQ